MSNLINKAKAAVSSNKSNNNNDYVDNPHSKNAGSHKSDALNTLDPRVDSDRDHRNDPASAAGGRGQTQHAGYGTTGGLGGTGNQLGIAHSGAHAPGTVGGNQSTNAGPHGSNFSNTVDPRVDSDRDGSRHIGGTGNQPGLGHTGTHASGYVTSATPGSGNAPNAGPHNSAALNKFDPRVDSDFDGSRTTGGNATMR